MDIGPRAVHAFSWAQVEVEDIAAAPLAMVVTGACWRWRGEALRLDGPQGLLPLGPAAGAAETRARAARALHRWLKTPAPAPESALDPEPARQGFTVTDGRHAWEVALVATGAGRAPLAVVAGSLPPRARDLWVIDSHIVPEPETIPEALLCFTPGTMILCADGPRPIEAVTEGTLVQTRDNGCQPVLWRGARRIGGARLRLMPHLAPVRLAPGALGPGGPERALMVSPDHRMLLRGARARALFGCDEVLAAARDLIDDRNVRVLRGLSEVRYLHLALPAHEVVLAEGAETESFLPDDAALRALAEDERQRLPESILPARRLLSRAEAVLVAQAA